MADRKRQRLISLRSEESRMESPQAPMPNTPPKLETETVQRLRCSMDETSPFQLGADLLAFWEFCTMFAPLSPSRPFAQLEPPYNQLRLVGPFRVFQSEDQAPDPTHFFYDTPELTPILQLSDEFHWAIFGDEPHKEHIAILKSSKNNRYPFSFEGCSVFGALVKFLQTGKQDRSSKRASETMVHRIIDYCGRRGIDYRDKGAWERRKPVSSDVLGLGVCVPYDKKTQVGYRPLKYNARQLRDLLRRHAEKPTENSSNELTELMTYVNIANDESDVGTGIQIARAFYSADEPTGRLRFRGTAKKLLRTSYALLDRERFADFL